MTMDARYGFQFHDQPVHQEREKCAYLSERFMSPNGRRCYIPKPERPPSDCDLILLRCLLDRFDRDYALIILRRPDDPVSPICHSHALQFFAPNHAADQADEVGYDELFERFPLLPLRATRQI